MSMLALLTMLSGGLAHPNVTWGPPFAHNAVWALGPPKCDLAPSSIVTSKCHSTETTSA